MPASNAIPDQKRRLVLQQLARVRLKEIVERLGLEHQDAWSLEDLIRVVLDARSIDFREVLKLYWREELQLACDALGDDRRGRGNAVLIARIMGRLAEPVPAGVPPEARPQREPAPGQSAGGDGDAAGFQATLFEAAEALRVLPGTFDGNRLVLGLLLLKYLSDAFAGMHAKLLAEKGGSVDPEDRAAYRAARVFWIPKEARWSSLHDQARLPTLGELIDDAMAAVERENPGLEGVLPKGYARSGLDRQRLGELVELITTLGRGEVERRSPARGGARRK